MTELTEAIAKTLMNVEYCNIPPAIVKLAEENNIVIAYGASADLLELEGAITDEVGAYGGVTYYLSANGSIKNECSNENCPYHEAIIQNAYSIELIPHLGHPLKWHFETSIPHHVFPMLRYNSTDPTIIYCMGIVFSLEHMTDS